MTIKTRILVTSTQMSVPLTLPADLIGKEVEVEVHQTPVESEDPFHESKRLYPSMAGALKLTPAQKQDWSDYLKDVRNEWD